MLIKDAIYLDANAGIPLGASVKQLLFSFLSERSLFNPSSIHSRGRSAKRALAEAREQVALSFGPKVDPEQVIFTSSGTEANQLAIRSVLELKLLSQATPHWVTTPVEHDSSCQMVSWWKAKGGSMSYLPVNEDGVPQVEALEEVLKPETALVSCIWVNNETGVISDVSRLVEIAQSYSIPVHLDAAQAWGKIPLDLDAHGAQYVSFSAHKIGGLGGTGVLWTQKGNPVTPHLLGKQEKGRRGGTENLMGAITAGAAASQLDPLAWVQSIEPLRDRLQDVICSRIPGTQVNGGQAKRVANTLNLNFKGLKSDGLVMALDLEGYCVSSGSACSSGALEPSHVLLAMGRSKSEAQAAIRVSLSEALSWEVFENFILTLERAVTRLRQLP